tara:strand:+ start:994 stop:2589 length:1596 start_codon:yes stop_codon:yes gene_type:complete
MKRSAINLIQKVAQSKKFEPLLFLIFVCLHLLPALSGRYFPTLDGPAHLYNSQLIIDLVFNNNTELTNYFVLNNEPVPNWMGHFILALFNYFLPAFIAEKILIVAYVIALPYTFRKLVLQLNPEGALMSYLIFPFVYSFMFMLGFYNFSIAIVFSFLILRYWIKNDQKKKGFIQVVVLAFLLICLYFSHLVVFGITLLAIGIHILYGILISKETVLNRINKGVKEVITIVLASIFPLILGINFYVKREAASEVQFLSNKQLIQELTEMKFLDPSYSNYFFIFFLIFCFLTIFLIYKRMVFFLQQSRRTATSFFKKHDFWFILAILMLVLYFKLPNMQGGAGYISLRMNHLFFIFWMLWLVCNHIPKLLSAGLILFVLYSSLVINNSHSKKSKLLSKDAVSIHKVAAYIPPGSIVLPINNSDHWIMEHFSNYLGIDEPLIVLDNYESTVNYFPIHFNHQDFPTIRIKGVENNVFNCVSWLSNPYSEKIVYAPYIMVYGQKINTDCEEELLNIIKKTYCLAYRNEFVELYHIH